MSKFKEKIKILVIDSPIINVFAFRDGIIRGDRYILITSSIAKLYTKKELNFVIAYEFAHYERNHFLSTLISRFVVLIFLMFLSAFFLYAVPNLITIPVVALGSIKLRKQEYEADEV